MCSLGNYILKIKRRALRIRQLFYTWSCVLGGGCLVGRGKKGTELGIAGRTEVPAGLVFAADRRESVGHRAGEGVGHEPQGQVARACNAPSEALSLHPESSGSHSGVSVKRET